MQGSKLRSVTIISSYPNSLGKEGEDHINVNMESTKELGRVLSPVCEVPIVYPFIGKFRSAFNLGHWLRYGCSNNSLKDMERRALTKYIKNVEHTHITVNHFKAIMSVATWLKIRRRPWLIEEIENLEGDIKLASYYTINNVRISTSYSKMVLDISKEIITAINDGREPYHDKFCTPEITTDMWYLKDTLSRTMTEEEILNLTFPKKDNHY